MADLTRLADVVVVFERPKAILVRHGERERWVPRSLLRGPDLAKKDDRGTLVIPTWFAAQCGILTGEEPKRYTAPPREATAPSPPAGAPIELRRRFAAISAEMLSDK